MLPLSEERTLEIDCRYATRYKKGEQVVVSYTEPSDHATGVYDGAICTILKAEARDEGAKGYFNPILKEKVKPVLRCPLVSFGREEIWMGMHQLQKLS